MADGAADGDAHRRQRVALLTLAAVAVLAIGFLVGFFVRGTASDGHLSVPSADSVDVGFAQDMSVHHNQAIEMATIEMARGADPVVKNLAYDILTTQQDQVGRMEGWLTLWGQPLAHTGGYMAWMSGGHGSGTGHMTGMGGGPVATMPGMASATDLQNLRDAQGEAADVLFLQLMLRHHEGGTPMLEYATKNAGQAVVRDLSANMLAAQNRESALMRQMLSQKGAAPLPMN
ncbi:DUF305 domain-containing protein [Rhodococcus sp. D2-41]|uniref:DUF305 domain-containing protein n=1 Tax=Speluncibacter jeojiensis TaxID=2710754 RepID=A0A9X4RJD1_9ACTN|nr:DUF305 domain-containing protein [Rhodococcus sp. D2-41]MDG3012824.1 DUF305 domain-containing protein [Rhodococcus sp. D2-41]MDG3017061.1 DUF305 domain-containing protein [Corynebacteriales bacterium D3-21]